MARELEVRGAVEKIVSLDEAEVKRDLQKRVADVKGPARAPKEKSAADAAKALTDKVELNPVDEHGVRGYRVRGSFERLLTGAALEALPRTMVPTGPEPVFEE